MLARLISLDYFIPQCDTSLAQFPVVIGHAADADIQLHDQSISNHHCEIDCVNGRLIVRDLGSVRGTFVNRARIDESLLMPGDELAVGMMTFLVQGCPEEKREPRTVEERGERQQRQEAAFVLSAT